MLGDRVRRRWGSSSRGLAAHLRQGGLDRPGRLPRDVVHARIQRGQQPLVLQAAERAIRAFTGKAQSVPLAKYSGYPRWFVSRTQPRHSQSHWQNTVGTLDGSSAERHPVSCGIHRPREPGVPGTVPNRGALCSVSDRAGETTSTRRPSVACSCRATSLPSAHTTQRAPRSMNAGTFKLSRS